MKVMCTITARSELQSHVLMHQQQNMLMMSWTQTKYTLQDMILGGKKPIILSGDDSICAGSICVYLNL